MFATPVVGVVLFKSLSVLAPNFEIPVFGLNETYNLKLNSNRNTHTYNDDKISINAYISENNPVITKEDEKYIPKDLIKLDGYLNAYKSTSNSDLFKKMFTVAKNEIDCSKPINIGELAYILEAKITYSNDQTHWYHIAMKNQDLMVSSIINQREIIFHSFQKDQYIELSIKYKNPIIKDSVETWVKSFNM